MQGREETSNDVSWVAAAVGSWEECGWSEVRLRTERMVVCLWTIRKQEKSGGSTFPRPAHADWLRFHGALQGAGSSCRCVAALTGPTEPETALPGAVIILQRH